MSSYYHSSRRLSQYSGDRSLKLPRSGKEGRVVKGVGQHRHHRLGQRKGAGRILERPVPPMIWKVKVQCASPAARSMQSLFCPSPRLDGGGARPSKAPQLNCHLSLNLDPSAKTFAGGPTVDSVFGIGRNHSFDVLGLDSVDPSLISDIAPSPCGDLRCLGHLERRHRKQAHGCN